MYEGYERAKREDETNKTHAKALLDAGVISESMAEKIARPWHEKGVLSLQWDEEYLDPSLKHDIEIMDIDKARKIQYKKDQAEKKWLEKWNKGLIDDWGNPIPQGNDKESGDTEGNESEEDLVEMEEQEEEDEEGREVETAMSEQENDNPVEIAPSKQKEPLKGPASEKVTKKKPAKKNSSQGELVNKAPAKKSAEKKPAKDKSVDNSADKSAAKATAKSGAKSGKKSAKTKTVVPVPNASATNPGPGARDYKELNYAALLNECHQRTLISGGSAATIRARLIADDIAVRDGTERKDVSKYGPWKRENRGKRKKEAEANSKKETEAKCKKDTKAKSKETESKRKKGTEPKSKGETESSGENKAEVGAENKAETRRKRARADDEDDVEKKTGKEVKKRKVVEASVDRETVGKRKRDDGEDGEDRGAGTGGAKKRKTRGAGEASGKGL